MSLPCAIITDPIFREHKTGRPHPECPERYEVIVEALKGAGYPFLGAHDATTEDILRCHTEEYYELVQNEVEAVPEGQLAMLSTGDAVISPHSFKPAMRAAGAVICGVDAVMSGSAKTVFCVVRPPGHHATKDKGMGFCLFNNIAIGARYAQAAYGINRVLIVDWDVHHGNGTQDIFEDDASIFYFSTHQQGLYPGTGKKEETGIGDAEGAVMNLPIPGGRNGRIAVLEAFKKDLIVAMQTFQPELVMISAGFDAHEKDPLGGFNLTTDDFGTLTGIVKQIANKYCAGRIVSVLEGGYDLDALVSSVTMHVGILKDN